MKWFNLKREFIEDYIDYVRDYLINNPKTEIYVSTDSQNKADKTKYVSVIVLYQKGKGGHVIFSKRFEKRTIFGKASGKDFNKLYLEVVVSKEIADALYEGLNHKIYYNKDEAYFSNKLLNCATGMLFDSAEKVRSKPNALACYAADKLVKGL